MGGMFDDLLSTYEISHGYEEVTISPIGLEKTYRKRVMKDDATVGFIEIDACTYESDLKVFHEDEEKELPFELCSREEYIKRLDLENGLEAYIPRKSLLFLYKLKAFRDRSYDLKTKGATLLTSRREWLSAKRAKDGSDMIALLDPNPYTFLIKEKFDISLFEKIVEEFNLHFALESLDQLPFIVDSLNNYPNATSEDLQNWIKKLYIK
jgi:hypothetical protein